MQSFGRVSAFWIWIWIFLVWTLNSSPKVCAYRWTSYQSLRQNQSISDSSELVTHNYDQQSNKVVPTEPSQFNSLENIEHHVPLIISNYSIKRIENYDDENSAAADDDSVRLRREWLGGLTSGDDVDESYPSFQDFLERFSEVGVAFIIRDSVAAFLAREREERELSGSLAKVGVIAFVLKNMGEYGTVSGLVEKEAGRSLLRFSRYLGFGIFMIGTTKDYFTFFEDTQCLIHGYQAHAYEGWRSEDYQTNLENLENSHSQSHPHSHFHEVLQAQRSQAQQTAVISHSPEEKQERNHLVLHSCRGKSEHEMGVLKSVASVAAAVFSYLRPEYGELLAYGEAALEGLSFLYRQDQDGHLFQRMGLPGDFFSLQSLEKIVQHL